MIYVLLPSYFLGVNMCCVDILDFFYKKNIDSSSKII